MVITVGRQTYVFFYKLQFFYLFFSYQLSQIIPKVMETATMTTCNHY